MLFCPSVSEVLSSYLKPNCYNQICLNFPTGGGNAKTSACT